MFNFKIYWYMRISGFTTTRPEPHGTRTYED